MFFWNGHPNSAWSITTASSAIIRYSYLNYCQLSRGKRLATSSCCGKLSRTLLAENTLAINTTMGINRMQRRRDTFAKHMENLANCQGQKILGTFLLAIVSVLSCVFPVRADGLEAGAAKTDITPPVGFPMWGYASRKDKPSEGVLDSLFARAIVLKAGEAKIALVSLDLGRPPTRNSMTRIRNELKKGGFTELFLIGSHTHHGPVLELDTWPTPEKPYTRELEEKLISLVKKADAARVPARYGIVSGETKLNRNRQSKRAEPPVDSEIQLLRFEDTLGKPIAHAVNFAAHPTMHPAEMMKFSADYPGAMAKVIETQTGVPCLFLQGAAGDLSTNSPEGIKGPEAFGKRLGEDVLKLAGTMKIAQVKESILLTDREELKFASVIDIANPQIKYALGKAFFPELITFFVKEYKDGIRPTLTVAILDNTIGFVGVSGELFCEHALSLRRRARLEHVVVMGYCNDYQQYFPTIQAAAEGGYGTVPPMAIAEVGAGEQITNRALIKLYQLRGKLPDWK
jgi:neutral ceramidase